MSLTSEELKTVLESVLGHHHHVYEVLDPEKSHITDVLDYLMDQGIVTEQNPGTLRYVAEVEIEENVSKIYAFFDEALAVDTDLLNFVTEIWEATA